MTKRAPSANSRSKTRPRIEHVTTQVTKQDAQEAGPRLSPRAGNAAPLAQPEPGAAGTAGALPAAEPVLAAYHANDSLSDAQEGTARTKTAPQWLERVAASKNLPYFGRMKPPRREDTGAAVDHPASPAASVVQDLREQMKKSRPDDLAALRIPLNHLSNCAAALLKLQGELLLDQPGLCQSLKITVHYPPGDEAHEQVVDLSCLEPLAEQKQGLVLVSLQVELSVRNGLPRGLYSLLKGGKSLLRLGLVCVHHDAIRAPLLESYLEQCMRLRLSGLKSLALQDFAEVVTSRTLARVTREARKKDRPLRVLALSMDQPGALPADFRLAELIGPGIKTLHLQGLPLLPDHLQGIGSALGKGCELEELKMQRCVIKGESIDLFAALACNQSLQRLSFFHNVVQVLPPERFLRLLSQRATPLQSLHIDEFIDPNFKEWLAALNRKQPELELTLHGDYYPDKSRLRLNWNPEPLPSIATAPTVRDLPLLPACGSGELEQAVEKSGHQVSKKVSWSNELST